MKTLFKFLPLVLFVAVATGLSEVVAEDELPATQPTENQVSSFDAIRNAPTPSAAVDAYARAMVAAEPGSKEQVAAESAYLKRMVGFGLPVMAESQARDLTQRDSGNAQAWAALAAANAERGSTDAALGQIQTAARLNSDDPFVQRTAGQLLAWYDTHPDAPRPPDAIVHDLPFLRESMASHREYDQAYRAARDEYQMDNATSRPTTGLAEGYIDQDVAIAPPVYPVPYSSAQTYGYYGYRDWGYRDWSPTPWWWYGPSVFIVNDHFHGHHSFHNRFHNGSVLVPPGHFRSHGNFGDARFHDFSNGFIGGSTSMRFGSSGSVNSFRSSMPNSGFNQPNISTRRMSVPPTFVGPTRMPRSASGSTAPRFAPSRSGGGGGGGMSGGGRGGGGGGGGRGR